MPALIRKQLSRQSNVAAVVMLSLLFAVDFTIGFDRVCWCIRLLGAPSMILSAPFCLRRRLRHGARHGACHGSITEEEGEGGIVNCRMIFDETSKPPWSREGKKIHVTVANRRLLWFLRDWPRTRQGFSRLCFLGFAGYSALKTRANPSSTHRDCIGFTLTGPARSIPQRIIKGFRESFGQLFATILTD